MYAIEALTVHRWEGGGSPEASLKLSMMGWGAASWAHHVCANCLHNSQSLALLYSLCND